jgi:hypothetical protein
MTKGKETTGQKQQYGAHPEEEGDAFQGRIVENEVAVAIRQEFEGFGFALAGFNAFIDLVSQIFGQISIRISKGLVLANETAQFVNERFIPLGFCRILKAPDFDCMDRYAHHEHEKTGR